MCCWWVLLSLDIVLTVHICSDGTPVSQKGEGIIHPTDYDYEPGKTSEEDMVVFIFNTGFRYVCRVHSRQIGSRQPHNEPR